MVRNGMPPVFNQWNCDKIFQSAFILHEFFTLISNSVVVVHRLVERQNSLWTVFATWGATLLSALR